MNREVTMPEGKSLESITLVDKKIRADALAHALKTIRIEDFEIITAFLRTVPLISLNEAWAIIHNLNNKVTESDRNDVLKTTQNTLYLQQKNL